MKKGCDKKGLSQVVSALLIMLLVIVLIVIVWGVVRNVLEKQGEGVFLEKVTINLDITKVKRINDTNINVTIKREIGRGEIYGVYFVVYDKNSSEVMKYPVSMKELQEKNFEISLYVLNASKAERIAVAPIFQIDSGKEIIGEIKDEYIIGNGGSSGIINPGCTQDSECTDPNLCTVDRCSNGVCLHTPMICNDNNLCTNDLCSSGTCDYTPITCSLAHATSSCSNGNCAISSCNSGWSNCNGLTLDGCETNVLTNISNCGSCGSVCSLAHATSACSSGTCTILLCATGWRDCNSLTLDGCETNILTNISNCGSCGNNCLFQHVNPVCTNGVCSSSSCATGWGNCDGVTSNGCETNLLTNISNCGSCGSVCSLAHATSACSNGNCGIVLCVSGWGNCDGVTSNGCETPLNSVSNCGSCGNTCSLAHATSSCSSGSCVVSSCNSGWGNCNGLTLDGCETNILTNISNCGSCGNTCSLAHATSSCSNGNCAISSCNSGWGNCNGLTLDGCETNVLTNISNCGSCGSMCSLAHATSVCSNGNCGILLCATGWRDCNSLTLDGCETNILTNISNCGSCGNNCLFQHVNPVCTNGVCSASSCATGWGNCDGIISNGCETNLLTNISNCGSCGSVCSLAHATSACSNGNCGIVLCASGWGNCDGVTSNGCETPLNSVSNCGSCGNTCSLAHATSSCSSGSCVISSCATGWGNCDGVTSNGCETNLLTNISNCGNCGNNCSTGYNCVSGACGISENKFTKTFLIRIGGLNLRSGDEINISKHDYIIIGRARYDDLSGGSFNLIKSRNPNAKIFIYINGPQTSNFEDTYSTVSLLGIARYNTDRGHSKGDLNNDNPGFFLLNSSGNRINVYGDSRRFEMDFGSSEFADYWSESAITDIVNQPWKQDGIFADNCISTYYMSSLDSASVLYNDADNSWRNAMNSFCERTTNALLSEAQLMGFNRGMTAYQDGYNAWMALDNIANPPDFSLEEGTFATSWGCSPTTHQVQFVSHSGWKRSVDILKNINNYKVLIHSHSLLKPGESGIALGGQAVSFWDIFYYSLASFHIGAKENSYFSFGTGNYSLTPWYEEYELIDLGEPLGDYSTEMVGSATIYKREFERGYVYVNPTTSNALNIQLPELCRPITHENIKSNLNNIPAVNSISLNSYRGAFLLKGGQPAQIYPYIRTFYVNATTGNDANSGTSPSTPWRTLSKVNSYAFQPGDGILFRKGDSWYGPLIPSSSGNSTHPITYSSYGIGNKPIISGFTTLTSWSSVSGYSGVYQSICPLCNTNLNMVTMNNVQRPIGRWPDSGWMTIDSAAGTTSITDSALPASPDWDGAEVVIRKNHWVIDRNRINTHSSNTITYSSASTYPGLVGFGYFIQNDSDTLTSLGEWYFEPVTRNLRMYFGSNNPLNYNIKASSVGILINSTSKSYVTFDNLKLEGANLTAVSLYNSRYIKLQNCEIDFSGTDAIKGRSSSTYLTIENNTINNTNNNAIETDTSCYYTTIRNNVIENTGIIPGMGKSGDGQYNAIISRTANDIIEFNSIKNTGYLPIDFRGENTLVKNNFIINFCSVKDDGGAIYTWNDHYSGKKIIGNVVINGIGAPAGANTTKSSARGIYIDGSASNVEIINNTVANCTAGGLNFNGASNITIKGNTIYNNTVQMSMWGGWYWEGFDSKIRDFSVSNNIFFSKENQKALSMYLENLSIGRNVEEEIASLGNFNNNYYYNQEEMQVSITYEYAGDANAYRFIPYSFEKWINCGHDSHSVLFPVINTYNLNSLISSNKIPNSRFDSNISGWVYYGSNATLSWDNNNVLDGGSLKATYDLGWNYYNFYPLVGAIDSSRNYLVRLSGLSDLKAKTLGVYFVQHHSPYNRLSETEYFSITDTRSEKEILISYPTTDTSTSLRFQIGEGNSSFYIDNVQLYEADVTLINPDNYFLFEYNPTQSNRIVTLPSGNYIDVTGRSYSGSVTLRPYTSIILIKN